MRALCKNMNFFGCCEPSRGNAPQDSQMPDFCSYAVKPPDILLTPGQQRMQELRQVHRGRPSLESHPMLEPAFWRKTGHREAKQTRKFMDGIAQFFPSELERFKGIHPDCRAIVQSHWGSHVKAVMVLATPVDVDPEIFTPYEDDTKKRYRMNPSNYKVVDVNHSFSRITGIEPDAVVGFGLSYSTMGVLPGAELRLLDVSLSRSQHVEVKNVVLSPKGSGKPAKSFDVTYIPLGDLARNPAYHCLYLEDRGFVADDKLLYLKQIGEFNQFYGKKSLENEIKVMRTKDPDIAAQKLKRTVEMNKNFDIEASERRRSFAVPTTIATNIHCNLHAMKESRVVGGHDTDFGRVKMTTDNPFEHVSKDGYGTHEGDPHCRKYYQLLGQRATRRYQEKVEAVLFIENDPNKLSNLSSIKKEIRAVSDVNHPLTQELNDRINAKFSRSSTNK